MEKRKRDFETLTAEEKRVTLAQDVLESIRARRLLAYTSCWMQLPSTEGGYSQYLKDEEILGKLDPQTDLQEIVNTRVCKVCALGAIFAETVRTRDKFKIADITDTVLLYPDIQKYLSDLFDNEQLMYIEFAYEGGSGQFKDRNIEDESLKERLYTYYNQYENDEDRMIVIMENIITNKGTFVP